MRASTRVAVLATATAVFSFTGGTAGVAEFGDRPDSGDQSATVSDGQPDQESDGSR